MKKLFYFCLLLFAAVNICANLEMTITDKLIFRKNAPIRFNVAIKVDQIFQGKLVFHENETLFYSSKNLVLHPQTKNNFEIFLPNISQYGNLSWKVFFETKEETYYLEQLDITTVDTIISVTTKELQPLHLLFTDVHKTMSIYKDKAIQGYYSNSRTQNNIHFMEEIPKFYWQYFNSDVVVIDSQTFLKMTKQEMDALDKWIKMGGSACIEVFSNNYHVPQRQFIENIVSSTDAPNEMSTGVLAKYYGWGRVVVLDYTQQQRFDFKKAQWKKRALFLYNVAENHTDRIVNNLVAEKIESKDYYYRSPMDHITSSLIPNNIEVAPTGVLFMMLFMFLILVGPVEYVVLKRMRKMVLTWVTLPIMTVIFWMLCQGLASFYMGDSGGENALEIIDLDDSGNIVKINTIKLSIYPFAQKIENNLENVICTKVQNVKLNYSYYYNLSLSDASPQYHGVFPQNYSMSIEVNPWSPYVERYLDVPDNEKVNFTVDLQKLKKEYLKDEYLHLDNVDFSTNYNISQNALASIFNNENFDQIFLLRNNNFYTLVNKNNDKEDYLARAFVDINTFSDTTILAKIAPKSGGTILEDLAVHDSSNALQYILLLVRREEDKTILFRQLFYDVAE